MRQPGVGDPLWFGRNRTPYKGLQFALCPRTPRAGSGFTARTKGHTPESSLRLARPRVLFYCGTQISLLTASTCQKLPRWEFSTPPPRIVFFFLTPWGVHLSQHRKGHPEETERFHHGFRATCSRASSLLPSMVLHPCILLADHGEGCNGSCELALKRRLAIWATMLLYRYCTFWIPCIFRFSQQKVKPPLVVRF